MLSWGRRSDETSRVEQFTGTQYRSRALPRSTRFSQPLPDLRVDLRSTEQVEMVDAIGHPLSRVVERRGNLSRSGCAIRYASRRTAHSRRARPRPRHRAPAVVVGRFLFAQSNSCPTMPPRSGKVARRSPGRRCASARFRRARFKSRHSSVRPISYICRAQQLLDMPWYGFVDDHERFMQFRNAAAQRKSGSSRRRRPVHSRR